MFHFTAGFAIKVCGEKLLSFDRAGHMHRVYTFPPGASVPWHIHPDAHDFDYELVARSRCSPMSKDRTC